MCERGRRRPWGFASLALFAVLAVVVPASGLGDDNPAGDPFRPPGWGEREAPVDDFDKGAWRLESTLISNGRRVAIINGRAVTRGDRIGGARVLAIEPGAARLDHDGREFTVRRERTRVRRQ